MFRFENFHCYQNRPHNFASLSWPQLHCHPQTAPYGCLWPGFKTILWSEWNHLQVETCKHVKHMIFYLIIFASWLVESCAYNSIRILSCTCNLYVDPFFGPCGATPDSDRQALNLFGAIKFCYGARPRDETVRCAETGLWRMFGRWKFCLTSNEEVAGNDLPVACLSANKLFSSNLRDMPFDHGFFGWVWTIGFWERRSHASCAVILWYF